jgi:hypothetical protein
LVGEPLFTTAQSATFGGGLVGWPLAIAAPGGGKLLPLLLLEHPASANAITPPAILIRTNVFKPIS